MPEMIKCAWCGKEIEATSQRRYCSETCRYRASYERVKTKKGIKQRSPAKKKTVLCETCGKPFEVYDWAKRRFCSRECANRVIHGTKPKKEVFCAYCGQAFKKNSQHQKFCSVACRSAAAERRTEEQRLHRAHISRVNALNKSTGKLTLDEMAALANSHHVSYGKMAAWVHINGRLPELGEIIR